MTHAQPSPQGVGDQHLAAHPGLPLPQDVKDDLGPELTTALEASRRARHRMITDDDFALRVNQMCDILEALDAYDPRFLGVDVRPARDMRNIAVTLNEAERHADE